MTTVKVEFHWATYRPDARQYKQQSMEVTPFLPESGNQPIIEVDLPTKLLANAEEYLKAGIEGTKLPQPILSIAAVKYLVDEWEKVFSDPQVALDDFKPATDDNDNWDENDVAVPQDAGSSDDDNWDEVDKTENPEEQWDDTAEDWGEDK